jgi:uncharacterized membrane protein (UPF0127 family)
MRSAWLLREGDVVCALDLADTWKERRRGLRARPNGDGAGAIHLEGVRTVHGAGLREAIDVAFLADDLTVLRVTRLAPWRLAVGRRGASSVLECQAGALERWGVVVGDQLVIREVQ